MTNLPNAPLIYTLGLVRFPMVPEIERFIPKFHDAVRAEYPHKDEIVIQQVQFELGPDGANVKQIPLTIHQFASHNRKLAIVLSQESLAVHTVAYQDNRTFIGEFENVFSKLIAIPEIGIGWTTSIALRYIDCVIPEGNENLSMLLKPSVLPLPFTDVPELNIIDGIYVAQYRTPTANVRFQILRNPQTVLPPDINTLLIPMNSWSFTRPAGEFAVVDTDCSVSFPNGALLGAGAIAEHMFKLRAVAKSIFLNIGTEQAERRWSKVPS